MTLKLKFGCFIPIRLNSQRLKKKALLKIDNKKTIIEYLIKNLCNSFFLNNKNIIVCTTKNSKDNILCKFLKKKKILFFRGNTKDIIKRFVDTNKKYNFDIITEVDGDDVLTDVNIIDKLIKKLINKKLEYIYTVNLPIGLNCKVFTKSALKKVSNFYKSKKNENGFMMYFKTHPLIRKMEFNKKVNFNGRFTLDYIEDYRFLLLLIKILKLKKIKPCLKNYQMIIKSFPYLKLINLSLQKKWDLRTKKLVNLKYFIFGRNKTINF